MKLYPAKYHRSQRISIKRQPPQDLPISDAFFREYMKISHQQQSQVIQSCLGLAENALFEQGSIAIMTQQVTVSFEYAGARARFPDFPVSTIDEVKVIEDGVDDVLTPDQYVIVNEPKNCVELNKMRAGRLDIKLTAGYAMAQADVRPEHRYMVANIAGAYYLRDNNEVQKQLNNALALIGA